MTEKRRPVTLYPDEVRNTRTNGQGTQKVVLSFDMPYNDKSDRIREGGQVIFDGALYEVTRREDLRPPLVEERTVEFSLVAPSAA
jgi:predicted kinase